MKRSLLVAAVATVASTAALAQSNVTIYGRLNTSVERQKTDADTVTVLQNNSSRIGFKGTEDLGGGLKAGFQLEHGFDVDDGTQSQASFWARQSEVFVGGNFGTVRLGNFTSESYYATADYVSMHNHDTGTSADALYAYVGRDTNKIAYRAPELAKGLSLEAAMSLAEGAPGTEKSYDLAANYDMGPLHLGAGYQKNDDAQQFALRALYELGDFVFGGYVQRDKDFWTNPATATTITGSRTNVRLSGVYTMGLSEFHLNVGSAGDAGDLDESKASQVTLGYNYNLSKRSKVFAFYTKLNDGDAGVYGGDFSSFALGVRHNF